MAGTRDMTAANWARTLKRLRRNAEELKAHDFQVIEPSNVEIPACQRGVLTRPVDRL